jgi:hypothetical protein
MKSYVSNAREKNQQNGERGGGGEQRSNLKLNVTKQTIPTERLSLAGEISANFVTKHAQKIICKLKEEIPSRRYSSDGAGSIPDHVFFFAGENDNGVDFLRVFSIPLPILIPPIVTYSLVVLSPTLLLYIYIY